MTALMKGETRTEPGLHFDVSSSRAEGGWGLPGGSFRNQARMEASVREVVSQRGEQIHRDSGDSTKPE